MWADLAGAPVETLFREVSCGDVGIEGVKVIISADRYDIFITRIESLLAGGFSP
jgi:hypothetical protein